VSDIGFHPQRQSQIEYIFALLFKDREAVAGFVDGTLHVLRFAR
jgi:hypothetical protein